VAWRELLNRQYALSLLLVCFAVWLHAADSLLVATMIPAIVADIGGINLVSWTVALYQLGSIVAGAASGLLCIRFGIKTPMVLAALVYAIGCAISAMAAEMWILLVGRQIQGLGGGALIAISFVSIGILFPRRLVPRAMAAVSFVWGTSAFLGPLVGGLFVEYASWHYGFWFFALQALALLVWILTRVKPSQRKTEVEPRGRFPLWRLAWLSLGVLLIAWSGIEVSLVRTPIYICCGIICMIIFLRMDSARESNRLLPRHPLGLSTRLGAGFTMILCFTIATIAISVYGPLLMTQLHGVSALVAGYVIACSSIGWSIAAVSVSGLAEKYDSRMIKSGMLLLLVSIMGFIYSVPLGPVWLIALFALIEGAGFGMSWTFILRRVTYLATASEQERVAAAMPTIQRFGYAFGAAYIGIIANAMGMGMESIQQGDISTVARAIFLACLPFALIGSIAAIRFVSPGQP